jgi:secreted trypsin-like serine protease
VLAAAPAQAVVRGEVTRDPDGIRQYVVRVESSEGELCSGVLIAHDLVLTAAHCVIERAAYRVVAVDRAFRSRTVRVGGVAAHPAFVAGTTPRTQPGVDLAILKLERPLGPEFTPLDPRTGRRVTTGETVVIAGFGVIAEARKNTARTLRHANLVALGPMQVMNRVLVVVDAKRMAETPGAGACRGDSGGPILGRSGQLLGIVSWSSGAFGERRATACGGFTAVTPIAEHSRWISDSVQNLSRFPTARLRAVDWARSR